MTKETKIALVATAGIVILFFGLNFLKGIALFSNNEEYAIEFADISGLDISSPIYADGFQVGAVKAIEYDYTHQHPVRVIVGVSKALVVPEGTTATIESDMMGNVKVNLQLGSDNTHPLPSRGTIKGIATKGLMDQAAALVPAVEQMLPKLDSILTSLNTIMADPAIPATLHNTELVSSRLVTTTSQLNTLIASLNTQLPPMMAKADGVLDSTGKLATNLAALDLQATMQKVNTTITNIEDITNSLRQGEGTAGMLLRDQQLYLNLNSTLVSTTTLLQDLQQHPKRYVHFSLFGKKDK